MLCDRLVLTAGSFRSNPPSRTLEGLIDGAERVRGAELVVVPDRAEAIANVVGGARPGDVVSVLGRGNVVEAIHDAKVDDRGSLSPDARGGRRRRLDPVGTGKASVLQLGMKREQSGVGGQHDQTARAPPEPSIERARQVVVDDDPGKGPSGVFEPQGQLGGTVRRCRRLA